MLSRYEHINVSKLLCFVLALFFVSGINSNEIHGITIQPGYIIQQYNDAKCCLYINMMDSIDFPKGGTVKIDLMDSKNLLELSTGPTFATLIKLPKSTDDEEYRIRTDIIEYNGNKYAFFPFVAILDKDRNLKGTTSFSKISYQPGYFLNPDTYLYFNFIIEGKSPDLNYMLIYTRPKYFTKLNSDDLRQPSRKIQADEVPINLNKVKGEFTIKTDVVYGLPASVITIKPYNKWFD